MCCICLTGDYFLFRSCSSKLYLALSFYFPALHGGKRKTKSNHHTMGPQIKMASPSPDCELSPPHWWKVLESGSNMSHYCCHTLRKTPAPSSSCAVSTQGPGSEEASAQSIYSRVVCRNIASIWWKITTEERTHVRNLWRAEEGV